MKMTTIEVAGLGAALTALRLPFGKEERSYVQGSETIGRPFPEANYDVVTTMEINIHPADLKLMQTLVKRGDEHAKVIRGINVWVKTTATRKWWSECDTYRVGRNRLSSASTMHQIGQKPFDVNDFDVSDFIKECLTPLPEPESYHSTLHFDTPANLECKVLTMYGRDYEIWNNGDMYALEFTTEDRMPNGTIRRRTFPKTKLKLGYTRSRNGYFQVGIGGKRGRIEMVHRIMALAFVPNPDNKPFVNHIDGDKGNCSPSNLEWCTQAENNAHAHENGLMSNNTIRKKYLSYKGSRMYSDEEITNWRIMKAGGMTYKEISDKVGVNPATIENYLLYDGTFSSSEYTYEFRKAYQLEQDIEYLNSLVQLYNEDKDASILNDIKDSLPEGYLQTRIDMFSYQCLRTIVRQRRGHRLPEWHQFINWVRTLPLAEELIFVGLEEEEQL